jgi:hypothetical protein
MARVCRTAFAQDRTFTEFEGWVALFRIVTAPAAAHGAHAGS